MKINVKQVGMTLCLATTLICLSGCAGTRYDRSTGEYIDDKATVGRVEDALSSDPVYKLSDVKVTTYRGTVQLSGFVDNSEQKDRAQELAKNVPGVKEVVNNITVREKNARN